LKVRVLFLSLIVFFSIWAEGPQAPPSTGPADAIVENYCAATRDQAQASKAASMDVEIAASLPRLQKHGKLHGLRHISDLGRITYEKLRFEGDGTIKNEVIAKYLAAEAEAQQESASTLAVTPENYKFKYKGRNQLDGREAQVFQVTPKHKRQGLFKGEIWIDSATYLRVRESGYLVKTPSIFLKKVEFVRKYEIRDGISVPLQVQSTVDTWLVGKAELTIDFSNFSIESPKVSAAVEDQ
jgi:hypothetical protein